MTLKAMTMIHYRFSKKNIHSADIISNICLWVLLKSNTESSPWLEQFLCQLTFFWVMQRFCTLSLQLWTCWCYIIHRNLVLFIIILSACLHRPSSGCSLRGWMSAAAATLRSCTTDLLWMNRPHWATACPRAHRPLLVHSPARRCKLNTVHSRSQCCSGTERPFYASQTRLIFIQRRNICLRHKSG